MINRLPINLKKSNCKSSIANYVANNLFERMGWELDEKNICCLSFIRREL